MVTLKELNPKGFKTTPEIDNNLEELLGKVNKVRTKRGLPMIVTSGLRSMDDHKRIYKNKGIPENKIPMGSKHLYGQAVDFADPNGDLDKWCQDNADFLEEVGLWIEHPDDTPGWCHMQSVAPKSGKRFFKP